MDASLYSSDEEDQDSFNFIDENILNDYETKLKFKFNYGVTYQTPENFIRNNIEV